ncbi:hypothetical protein SASPL_104644 [Salvia splendens]|uniref:Uncharacterized protein n=1 Tax=Salvia splendens TaxID=180675 RepID=A0A8X8YJK5_SALSN|nr:hypothetical protein SASPL_104644 [Salvia splendens]
MSGGGSTAPAMSIVVQPAPPLYPTIDTNDLHNIFPSPLSEDYSPSAPPDSAEDSYFTIPGAIVHLIDKHYSVELTAGVLQIIRLRQGDNTVAVLTVFSDEIDESHDLASVKAKAGFAC